MSLPVGLCRRQKGETREEGGHILDMLALCMQKKHSFRVLFDNAIRDLVRFHKKAIFG